jgi:hypothetical protein
MLPYEFQAQLLSLLLRRRRIDWTIMEKSNKKRCNYYTKRAVRNSKENILPLLEKLRYLRIRVV